MERAQYAGSFSFALGVNDLRIFFADVEPEIDDSGNLMAEKREVVSKIIMPVPLAKKLCEQLAAALADYEGKIAPIIDIDKFQQQNESK